MNEIRLHIFQSQALKASLRDGVPYVLLLAGAQGGKTLAGAVWHLEQLRRRPKGVHLITAPTYKHLAQSTLLKLNQLVPSGWARWSRVDSCYYWSWGGVTFVRSLEDPDSIEGITADSIWADECGKVSLKAWHNMQARRSQTGGPWLGTTTPYANNWLKKDFFDLWKRGYPEYKVVQFRSIDSPYFPRESWDQALRDMDVRAFGMKFGGQFTSMVGLIYEMFDPATMVAPLHSVPASWQRIGGIDFGWSQNHPFAASVWASRDFRDPKTKIYKVFEYKAGQRLLEDHLQVLRAAEPATGKVGVWYADPSSAQEIAQLRSMGAPVRMASNPVQLGLDHVISLMKNGRYMLSSGKCPQTVDELETYRRDESGKIIKENDHIMDADRYCLYTHLAARSGAVAFM